VALARSSLSVSPTPSHHDLDLKRHLAPLNAPASGRGLLLQWLSLRMNCLAHSDVESLKRLGIILSNRRNLFA
jgi:hypothetical protein